MFGKSKGHSALFLRAVVVILGFACVAFPAKAEIVHLNTLGLDQTRSTDIATQYERQFNVLSDSRITSILLQPSETQTSSLFAFPSMRVSINGSEFRYVSRDETYDLDFGDLKLTGEFGYQADLSNSSKAQGYQLNDESLIYAHDVRNNDDAYSSSHSMVRVGADLTGDNGWTYSAKGHLRHYENGNIASVSLQAAHRF